MSSATASGLRHAATPQGEGRNGTRAETVPGTLPPIWSIAKLRSVGFPSAVRLTVRFSPLFMSGMKSTRR